MSRKKSKGFAPVRNWEARNPLMSKGGAHGKTRKAQRRRDRMALAKGQVPDLIAA